MFKSRTDNPCLAENQIHGYIMWFTDNFINQLEIIAKPYESAASLKEVKRSIIEAFSITDSAPVYIKSNAGNNKDVDSFGLMNNVFFSRLLDTESTVL